VLERCGVRHAAILGEETRIFFGWVVYAAEGEVSMAQKWYGEDGSGMEAACGAGDSWVLPMEVPPSKVTLAVLKFFILWCFLSRCR
jgi:hypothetical protein